MNPTSTAAACLLVLSFGAIPASAQTDFPMRPTERIVLIGSTLVEREQKYGHWETALTARWADCDLRFRNLGWSGDTVRGESRAGFGTAKEGYKKLIDLALEWKPTIIVLGYGTVESEAGKDGLAKFREDFTALIKDLEPAKAKFVLIAPPMPEGNALNEKAVANRMLYAAAMRECLSAAPVIDLLGWTQKRALSKSPVPLTDNGLHFTDAGYRESTEAVLAAFPRTEATGDSESRAEAREALRAAIVRKNELAFYRRRPQNETYLFGFRKHEQGKNGREVFEFDPLIEAEEKKIAELRRAFAR